MRFRQEIGFWADGQDHRRPGLLVEVEVADEVSEGVLVLARIESRVWAAVGAGVEPLPA